jgi:hypothetical protein
MHESSITKALLNNFKNPIAHLIAHLLSNPVLRESELKKHSEATKESKPVYHVISGKKEDNYLGC